MSGEEKYDVLVLGSGTAGSGWQMAQEGMRTAVVERRHMGGACVNIACLPSKNAIHTAKVASLVRRHQEFGIQNRFPMPLSDIGASPRPPFVAVCWLLF